MLDVVVTVSLEGVNCEQGTGLPLVLVVRPLKAIQFNSPSTQNKTICDKYINIPIGLD